MKATQKGASRTIKERLGQPLHEGNPKGASRTSNERLGQPCMKATTKEHLGQPCMKGNHKGASRPRARALQIKGKYSQEALQV